MWNDPIVAEVRTIRERLSAAFDFNVHAIFADLRSRQGDLGSRLVQRSGASRGKEDHRPDRNSMST